MEVISKKQLCHIETFRHGVSIKSTLPTPPPELRKLLAKKPHHLQIQGLFFIAFLVA